MSAEHPIPELPRTLTAPEPVIAVGMLAWLIATIVIAATGIGDSNTLWTSVAGLIVGLAGTAIVIAQRIAVRRGSRTAQRGLR